MWMRFTVERKLFYILPVTVHDSTMMHHNTRHAILNFKNIKSYYSIFQTYLNMLSQIEKHMLIFLN